MARIVDLALEASVVGGHTSVGYAARSRLENWSPPAAAKDLAGRLFVVTGATSGIGRSIATQLAKAGAAVRSVSRSPARALEATTAIRTVAPDSDVGIDVVDISLPDRAHDWGTEIGGEPVHGIVHAAGGYFGSLTTTDGGFEANAAVYLLGPFALTAALAPALVSSGDGRIITLSSSGAYATGVDLGRLDPDPDDYRPLRAYARAKRAQIVLTHGWQHRFAGAVSCHAMTPGWCDTDLVRNGLPRFRRFFRPILRTPDQGADTAVWLAANDVEPNRLWRDRRHRLEHRLPWTAVGSADPDEIWRWCEKRSGYTLRL